MDKNYNGFLGDEKECASVPYYVVESIIAVHKRQTIQLAIINLIIVAILIFGFAYIWTSYDYESSETTTVQQDGNGVNVFGDENDISNNVPKGDGETN